MRLRLDSSDKKLFVVAAAVCLWPGVSAGAGLLLGIVMALAFGNPYGDMTRKYTSRLLAFSVVGLGAGMNLHMVLEAGVKGLGYTVISIAACLALGWLLGRLLKVEREAALLITVGTAICGGSAIAAVAPVIHARHHNITAAMAVVFVLNAVALFLFPWVGHLVDLSQGQFGLWAALAIHDTSSVVGAGVKYGAEALQTATSIKLARALWIIPLVLAIQALYHLRADKAQVGLPQGKRKYPWFILGFLAMAALVTYVPQLAGIGKIIETIARQLLVLTLFLIGANLSRETLRAVGFTPMLMGVGLWIVVASVSLLAIYAGWIG